MSEFSDKELNYIWMALHYRNIDLQKMKGAGNSGHLLRFNKKLTKKVEVIRERQLERKP